MDTTPLETDLLRHREFLLRLATCLVGRNDAEDLVQDVWVRAVEHPRPPGSGARGWLAHVARNLAVNRFRSSARRAGRERDAARAEATSAGVSEVQERFELGRHLADAVGALEEPYRAVILLRFFEGLSHAEIARRLELPLATVRTRQQRALARLRERLDREAGGREAWSMALAGWLARTANPDAVVAAGGLGAAITAAVLVAVVIGGAWWRLGPQGGEAVAVESTSEARPEVRLGAVESVVPSSRGAAQRHPVASVPTSAPRTLLAGRVVGLTVEEMREAHVQVDAEWKRYATDHAPLQAAVEDDGSFAVDVGALIASWDEPADELVVVLDHPLHMRATSRVSTSKGVPAPSGDTLLDAGELAARDAAVARGVVHFSDGTPASGAAVMAYFLHGGAPRRDSSALEKCDGEGRYNVRLERGGDCLLAFLVEGVRPTSVVVSPRLGRAVELGTTTLEAGHAIGGRVTRLGMAMPQARVNVIGPIGEPYLDGTGGSGIAWLDGRVEWSHVVVEADSEGRFLCRGLAPASYSVSADGAARMDGLGFERESIEATAPCSGLALEFRSSLVSDPGLTVAFSDPGPLATLELEWIPDPELSLEAIGVHFESPEGVGIFSRQCDSKEAIDGVFRLEDVRPGRYRVRIHAGWDHRFEYMPALDRVLSVELAPRATTRERFAFELGGILRVDVRAATGERCSAWYRLLDAAGEPRPVRFRTKWGDNTTSETCFLSSRAEHRSETLPAGDYTLVLWTDDVVEQRIPVRIQAGETTDLAVTLQPR